MANIRQRIMAASGALVFLITASALTIAVVVQAVQDKHSQATATTQATACQPDASVAASTEALPEVFKPDGAVTQLQTTDLTTGSGKTAAKNDCLQVKYFGTLATTGAVFDENFDKPTAFKFQLGAGQVIPGWDQGVVGMKEGGVRRIVIPANLAYGSQSPSSAIPANSDLVFVVKLVKVN